MIVRAILQDPTIADNFDHFNDYDNTRNWLLCLDPSDERDIALARLDRTHIQYRITDAIKWTTRAYLKDDSKMHPKITDPYDINCGHCEDFAIEVLKRAGFDPYSSDPQLAEMVWIEDLIDTPDPDASHAVVRLEWFDGQFMYFDSECPKGTLDAAKIPAVANKEKSRDEVIAERKSRWW